MNQIEAAWLAGFLDGEGSFMITRGWHKNCAAQTYDAVIAATNTDRALIDRCKQLAGGKIVATKAKNAKHKDAHVWQLRGPGVSPVIEAVLPHLVSKKHQAQLLLRLRAITRRGAPSGRNSTRKTAEEVAVRADLYAQVQTLNRRGNPDYAAMAERRIRSDAGMFAEVSV